MLKPKKVQMLLNQCFYFFVIDHTATFRKVVPLTPITGMGSHSELVANHDLYRSFVEYQLT